MKVKKIIRNNQKYLFKEEEILKGVKYAFLLESTKEHPNDVNGAIFVSPSIFSLIESDPDLVQKTLKMYTIPVILAEDGTKKNYHDSLEEFLNALIVSGVDIFCSDNKKDKEKDK